jgi:hypothetical protein
MPTYILIKNVFEKPDLVLWRHYKLYKKNTFELQPECAFINKPKHVADLINF